MFKSKVIYLVFCNNIGDTMTLKRIEKDSLPERIWKFNIHDNSNTW